MHTSLFANLCFHFIRDQRAGGVLLQARTLQAFLHPPLAHTDAQQIHLLWVGKIDLIISPFVNLVFQSSSYFGGGGNVLQFVAAFGKGIAGRNFKKRRVEFGGRKFNCFRVRCIRDGFGFAVARDQGAFFHKRKKLASHVK